MSWTRNWSTEDIDLSDMLFWRVAVEDPEKRGHYPQVLALYNQAIATSGGYEMHYDAEGRHHHLLDPPHYSYYIFSGLHP